MAFDKFTITDNDVVLLYAITLTHGLLGGISLKL